MPRRLLTVAASVGALATLAVVSLAPAADQAASGSVVISGSGTRWTLTITNAASSTGPIKCWRYTFPPGVLATGIGAPPAGWQVGGNRPPPAPILAGRSNAGIAPGQSAAFPIVTDKPFDTGGPPGVAAVSEDCVTDATARVTFASTPKPTPCQCDRLDVSLAISDVAGLSAQGVGLTIYGRLNWKLVCTGGAGRCEGRIEARPSKPDARKGLKMMTRPLKLHQVQPDNVTCEGNCGKTTANSLKVALSAQTEAFDGSRLGTIVRSVSVDVERTCKRKRPTVTLELVFKRVDGRVRIDRAKSDLNGNEVPDGEE